MFPRARILIVGNIGGEPKPSFGKDGRAILKFRVAVNNRMKEGDEWVDGPTTWYSVTTFHNQAEAAAEVLTRGSKVMVEGRFQLREWTTSEGEVKVDADITADTVAIVPTAPKADQGAPAKRFAPVPIPVVDSLIPPF